MVPRVKYPPKVTSRIRLARFFLHFGEKHGTLKMMSLLIPNVLSVCVEYQRIDVIKSRPILLCQDKVESRSGRGRANKSVGASSMEIPQCKAQF